MSFNLRSYQNEDDYWRIRQFLRQVYLLNGRRARSWQVQRWDYWRWHVHENIFPRPLEEIVFLWETDQGEIAAVLHPESPGEAFLDVHPQLNSPQLETEMVSLAEERLAKVDDQGQRQLYVWAQRDDAQRRELLNRQGYSQGDTSEYQRRRWVSTPVDSVPPAPGYTVRPLGDTGELPARSWVSWKAFHPNEPDEHYEGWDWYRNIQRAPLYRRDLDLVAVAPDGELAGFCTVWFDDVTRCGVFEPVGVHPNHQQRGLGKALMSAGLQRLARLGATQATVGSYSERAHALYASAGFTEYDLLDWWRKEWE